MRACGYVSFELNMPIAARERLFDEHNKKKRGVAASPVATGQMAQRHRALFAQRNERAEERTQGAAEESR